jgi:hypothetical protein
MIPRQTLHFCRMVFIGFLAILLCGCSTTKPMLDASGKPIEVPAANFKLGEVQLVWLENLSFVYRVATVVARGSTGIPEGDRLKAQNDMKIILDFFRQESVGMLKTELDKAAIKSGNKQRITMMAISGNQDATGWGTGVVIRTVVQDLSTGQSWQYDLNSTSGIQLLGPRGDAAPTNQYVKNYAESIVEAFKRAQLIR